MVTLEAILDRKNLQRAMEQVARNKGAAGIDGYSAEDVRKWFADHPYKLTTAVRSGSYKPSLIKRVYIPKGNGEKRPLGIWICPEITWVTTQHRKTRVEHFGG